MWKIISPVNLFKTVNMRIYRRLFFIKHNNNLKHINNIDDFYRYLNKINGEDFLFYKNRSQLKRKEFLSVVDALQIDLKGISFLDIGPGYGDTLDICHERGSAAINFIDHDPFYYYYNRLKGFTTGYYLNHIKNINKLRNIKYNFIWCKGAIGVEQFILKETLNLKKYCLNNWLNQIEKLAAETCHILICPGWKYNGTTRYTNDIYNNKFTNIMLENKYKVLPQIKDFCGEVQFPIAYYKFIDKRNL